MGATMKLPKLKQSEIELIVELIEKLDPSEVTWDRVVKEAKLHNVGRSRVSLAKYLEIRVAYDSKKNSKGANTKTYKSKVTLLKDINKLQDKIARLKLTEKIQAQQFERWIYNANAKGISIGQFNEPLTKVKNE